MLYLLLLIIYDIYEYSSAYIYSYCDYCYHIRLERSCFFLSDRHNISHDNLDNKKLVGTKASYLYYNTILIIVSELSFLLIL